MRQRGNVTLRNQTGEPAPGCDRPLLSPQTLGSAVGHFTQSAFHFNATQVLTGTSAGKVVVWDVERKPGLAEEPQDRLHGMQATKLVPLQEESLTVLVVLERCGDAAVCTVQSL